MTITIGEAPPQADYIEGDRVVWSLGDGEEFATVASVTSDGRLEVWFDGRNFSEIISLKNVRRV